MHMEYYRFLLDQLQQLFKMMRSLIMAVIVSLILQFVVATSIIEYIEEIFEKHDDDQVPQEPEIETVSYQIFQNDPPSTICDKGNGDLGDDPFCQCSNTTCVIQGRYFPDNFSDMPFPGFENMTIGEDATINTGNKSLLINQTSLGCDFSNKSINCKLHIYSLQNESKNGDWPYIELKNSSLNFQLIFMQSNVNITSDRDSNITAAGSGPLNFNNMYNKLFDSKKDELTPGCYGGSYGGQGGSELDKLQKIDSTYGDYWQTYDGFMKNDMNLIQGSPGILVTEECILSADCQETRGGGTIILLSDSFTLRGPIDASGDAFTEQTQLNDDYSFAGGSGGYIYINQTNTTGLIFNNTFPNPPPKVNGGSAGGKDGCGGSGGRIVIDASGEDQISPVPQAFGGCHHDGQESDTKIVIGAAGTVYLNQTQKLIVKGQDCNQPYGLWQTPIKFPGPQEERFPNIQLDTYAILAPKIVPFSESNAPVSGQQIIIGDNGILSGPISNEDDSGYIYQNITVTVQCQSLKLYGNGQIRSSQSVDKAFKIDCNTIEMVDQSLIDVKLPYQSSIYVSEALLMNQGTRILTSSLYDIQGGDLTLATILSGGSQKGLSFASITANNGNIHLLENEELSTDMIGLVSTQNITIEGLIHPKNDDGLTTCISNEVLNQSVQPFVFDQDAINYDYLNPAGLLLSSDQILYNIGNWTRPGNNTPPLFEEVPSQLYSNFTSALIALQKLTISASAEVRGPRIGVYSDQVINQGLLNTTAWGCPAGSGPGTGEKATPECGATGASYAGQGGLPSSSCDSLSTLQTRPYKVYGQYDSMSVMEGSGGGTGLQHDDSAGRGGGYVWIQASDLILDAGSLITTDGGTAPSASSGGGGGSGGTIAISTFWLRGNGTISVQGGSGAQKDASNLAGGAGSGGRFKLLRYRWDQISSYNSSNSQYLPLLSENNIVVLRNGGYSEMNDSQPASIWSTPCPAGYAGETCSACPIGTFSDDVFNRQCQNCTNLPLGAHGSYNESGWGSSVCPYVCNGTIPTTDSNPMCLSTSALFLQNLGGPIIFAIIIISTLLLIFSVSYYLSENAKSKSLDKLIEQGDRAMGGTMRDDKKYGNTNHLKYLEENLKFFDRDVYQHFCRIYLVGNNRALHPWRLPLKPPASLRPRILLERYVQFANEINQEFTWTKLEIFGLKALAFLYPAALPRYIFWRRRNNCVRFLNLLSQKMDSERSFWKNDEDRMRYHTQFKFSFSKNVSLGCIDFLDQRLTADVFEGPQFPLTLFLGGEGLYHDPYNVDYENDPVIKSVGLKMEDHKIWKKFIQNLNSKLSSLQPLAFNFYLIRQFHDILEFINSANQNIFKYHNFKVSFWMVEHFYPVRSNSEEDDLNLSNEKVKESYYRLDLNYIKKKSAAFVNFLNYWRSETMFNDSQKEFRLCLVLQEIEKVRESGASGNQSTAKQRKSSFDGLALRREWPTESQYEESLQPKQDVLSNNSSSPDANNRNHSPYGFRLRNSAVRKDNDKRNEVVDSLQFIMSNIREPHIDKYWLKQFKYKDQHLTCFEKIKRLFQNFLLTLAAIVQMTTLRIQVNNSNIIAAIVPYIFFVLFDGLFTFAILGQIAHGKDAIFGSVGGALFIFFYPFASIISPILGALSMLSCKTRMFQNQAYLNALSLYANTLGLLIASIFNKQIDNYLITMSILLLITKFGLAQLLPLQISYFNNPKYAKNIEFLNQVKTLNMGRDPNLQGDNDSNNSDTQLSDQGSNSDMFSPKKHQRPSFDYNQNLYDNNSPHVQTQHEQMRDRSFQSNGQESVHGILTDDDVRVSSLASQTKKGGFSLTDKLSRKFMKRGNSNNKLQKRQQQTVGSDQIQQPMRQFEYDVQDYDDAGSPYKIEDLQPPLAMYGGIGGRDPRNEWNRDHDQSITGSNAFGDQNSGLRSRDSDMFNI